MMMRPLTLTTDAHSFSSSSLLFWDEAIDTSGIAVSYSMLTVRDYNTIFPTPYSVRSTCKTYVSYEVCIRENTKVTWEVYVRSTDTRISMYSVASGIIIILYLPTPPPQPLFHNYSSSPGQLTRSTHHHHRGNHHPLTHVPQTQLRAASSDVKKTTLFIQEYEALVLKTPNCSPMPLTLLCRQPVSHRWCRY